MSAKDKLRSIWKDIKEAWKEATKYPINFRF